LINFLHCGSGRNNRLGIDLVPRLPLGLQSLSWLDWPQALAVWLHSRGKVS
jgi:hypothetical protein